MLRLAVVQNQSRMINLPELEAVNRISNLPIVETGWNYAEYMYQRIKVQNQTEIFLFRIKFTFISLAFK